MARVACSLRPGIDHHLLGAWLIFINEIDAARWEGPGCRFQPGVWPFECKDSLIAKNPDRFLSQTCTCIFILIVENCAEREGVGHVLDSIPSWIVDPSSVIISKTFNRPNFGKCLHDIQHLFQYVVELFGNRKTAFAGKNSRVQEKVERVHVIVERLFEINSVGTDL